MTCESCGEEETLLHELADLSDKLTLETRNRLTEPDQAMLYGVTASPTLIIEGRKGARVRYLGLPVGYEFASLLQGIREAAAGQAAVTEDIRGKLEGLESRVEIRVFVTPTCPHCPRAVMNAQRLALEFPNIRAEMVEANEFPELAERYGVAGVPMTVVNDKVGFVGAQPEEVLVDTILKAAGSPA
jgi:glutaredoxin-like protein